VKRLVGTVREIGGTPGAREEELRGKKVSHLSESKGHEKKDALSDVVTNWKVKTAVFYLSSVPRKEVG